MAEARPPESPADAQVKVPSPRRPESSPTAAGRAQVPPASLVPPQAAGVPQSPAPAPPLSPREPGQGPPPSHQGFAPVPSATAGRPGTVYGGRPEDQPAPPEPIQPEDTGSLTGYILARGLGRAPEEPPSPRSRGVVIAVVILLGLAVMVAIGLLAINTVFDSLLGG